MKRLNKYLLWILIVIAATLGTVAITSAVTNGQPDGNGHPYVGLALFFYPDGSGWFCSGSLISPTVFLTAAHCTAPAAGQNITAAVLFDPTITQASVPTLVSGIHTNPDFCQGCGPGLVGLDSHDVGILILATPVSPGRFAGLPAENLVDSLGMNTKVTVVGYGGQVQTRGQPPHDWTWIGPSPTRFAAPTLLIQSEDIFSDLFIKLSANPGKGKGGTCFGDSGGPDLLGDTILAVNSFVTNGNCSGVTYSNRIDKEYALDWINSFLK